MTRHGFLELIGNSCLVLLPVAGAALAFPPFSRAIMATFAAGLFATNLFHKWAHDSAATTACAGYHMVSVFDISVHPALKCGNRRPKCHQSPAKRCCKLYLETEEWVSR
jgi:hypothetical protein